MEENLNNQFIVKKPTAALILENGEVFWGRGFGAETYNIGELCFNTSQTGYQETLTDPSYSKQIITFTFPHIGIVGTNNLDLESSKIHACGCILNQQIDHYSNWRSQNNLDLFLKKHNTPCITNIDTRYLTRTLAREGAKKAAIIHFGVKEKNLDTLKEKIIEWKGLENLDLATIVSTDNKYETNESIWDQHDNKYNQNNNGKFNIACLDFGIKKNILRNLNNNFFLPKILPANSSIEEILDTNPKGVFLSNGPGDPFATGKIVIPTIKKIIDMKIPIFGICLGHQILSLALGAKTKKMFQGHRGANHPVKNLIENKVEITSQNHGFEIIRESLPKNIQVTHTSLFDNSIEGIRLKNKPVFSVQYHPESNPGPQDSVYLFQEFINNMKKNAKKKRS